MALLVTLCGFVAPLAAAEPLRWKFAVGDNLQFEIAQQMRVELTGFDDPLRSDINERLEMNWRVASVDQAGDATIIARFSRIRATINSADGKALEYDSSSEDTPSGLAAMLGPLYQSLFDVDYQIALSPRGEMRDVLIPDEVRRQFEKGPGQDAMGVEAGIAAFKSTIALGVVPLPADLPQVGQTWTDRRAVSVPGTKTATVETKYKYVGTKEVDGKTCAVIEPTLTLELVGDDKIETTVTDQSSSGEILFDSANGRLHSLKVDHQATLEIIRDGKKYDGKFKQHLAVEVVEDD